MRTPKILSLVLTIIIVLNSCGDTKENSNLVIGDNSDTIQVTKDFPTIEFKEIIYYKKNKPDKYIAIRKNGDTLIIPSLFKSENETRILAFIPPYKNRLPQAILIANSNKTGKNYTEFLVDSLEHTFEFKISTDMIINDTIDCAIKYSGFYYIPVKLRR